MEIVVEKNQIQILDSIILNVNGGFSPQKSLRTVYFQLNHAEKIIFESLLTLQQSDFVKTESSELNQFLFELKNIINSPNKVLDQLKSFRNGLKLRKKFKTKVRQITQQIKAQACVSVLIYLILFGISWNFLGLAQFPKLIAVSVIMFVLGVKLVFKMGNRIKWNL